MIALTMIIARGGDHSDDYHDDHHDYDFDDDHHHHTVLVSVKSRGRDGFPRRCAGRVTVFA